MLIREVLAIKVVARRCRHFGGFTIHALVYRPRPQVGARAGRVHISWYTAHKAFGWYGRAGWRVPL